MTTPQRHLLERYSWTRYLGRSPKHPTESPDHWASGWPCPPWEARQHVRVISTDAPCGTSWVCADHQVVTQLQFPPPVIYEHPQNVEANYAVETTFNFQFYSEPNPNFLKWKFCRKAVLVTLSSLWSRVVLLPQLSWTRSCCWIFTCTLVGKRIQVILSLAGVVQTLQPKVWLDSVIASNISMLHFSVKWFFIIVYLETSK